MPNSVILTTQPAATLAVVPNQNTTLVVAASANFNVSSYVYQWKIGTTVVNATNISGATSASYFFEPSIATHNGKTLYCFVSGLSGAGNTVQATVSSTGVTMTVAADTGPYARHKLGPTCDGTTAFESGKERFLRLRNLGYF